MEEQSSLRAGLRLGQHLRRHRAEREPAVDDLVRQSLGGEPAALDDRVEADLLGVADALVAVDEDPAFVEIRDVDDVTRRAQVVGEGQAPGGESVRVMEEQHLGHGNPAYWAVAAGEPSADRARAAATALPLRS